MTITTYTCPSCGSDQVTTEHHQAFLINTGEHYCHSMKTHDDDSPAACLSCEWVGTLLHLTTQEKP